MHHDLCSLLDAHLAELTALRQQLAAPRPVQPGARWTAAAETAHASERYAAAVHDLLEPAPV